MVHQLAAVSGAPAPDGCPRRRRTRGVGMPDGAGHRQGWRASSVDHCGHDGLVRRPPSPTPWGIDHFPDPGPPGRAQGVQYLGPRGARSSAAEAAHPPRRTAEGGIQRSPDRRGGHRHEPASWHLALPVLRHVDRTVSKAVSRDHGSMVSTPARATTASWALRVLTCSVHVSAYGSPRNTTISPAAS